MTRIAVCIAVVGALLAPSSVCAQAWEVSGVTSYVPSVALDRQAPQLDQVSIRNGFTWGAQVGRSFTRHWAAEGLWTQQSSALEVGTSAGSSDLFTMTVSQLHANAVFQFGHARLQPFAFGGVGATFFRATDLQSETKLSLDVGGGIKYLLSTWVGIRGHVRYKPSMLNDEDSAPFCAPFGFCQGSLRQVEIAVGALVRF